MGFGGLYISITGLQASRMSLDTVSHNISNANNPNYVRQSAIHANNPYTTDGRFQKGTGVNVIEVRQILRYKSKERDNYIWIPLC